MSQDKIKNKRKALISITKQKIYPVIEIVGGDVLRCFNQPKPKNTFSVKIKSNQIRR